MAYADTPKGAGINSGVCIIHKKREPFYRPLLQGCPDVPKYPELPFPHSPIERAVFKSLSEFSSDPRRRAEAPVVTYSALSKRNLAQQRSWDGLMTGRNLSPHSQGSWAGQHEAAVTASRNSHGSSAACQAELLDSPMAASLIRSVNVGQNSSDTKESPRISISISHCFKELFSMSFK